ncbi:RluA family pseudouridine synthase [Candidatus Uhrbacteria bacterium]|nr:RluA family pseudouridine synthase [Candidatus Uhrbacteria bacterium]
MKQISVPAHAKGERLDVFLTSEWPETNRTQIAKRIKSGEISVNGKTASVHQFLKEGDEISILKEELRKPSKAAPKSKLGSLHTQHASLPRLDIIKETEDWIVVNKPVGVVVHPDTRHLTGTLVDAVLKHAPQMAKVGEDPSRPGIMHRLDKEVSGLMVFAKTQAAFDSLKHQFATHTVDKRYLALVHGEITQEEGDLKFRIARSTSKNRMAAKPQTAEDGKAAWTHYKNIRRFHHATLLELTILSGRTHQIRAHLLAFNHPVIGDPLYTRAGLSRSIKAPHTLLQNIHLAFTDPTTGERQIFDLTPSQSMLHMMSQLSPPHLKKV